MGAWSRIQWMTLLVVGGAGLYFGTLYVLACAADCESASACRVAGRRLARHLMELVRGMHNLRERHRGCVATIGNYDGVHLGHQHMIAAVRAQGDRTRACRRWWSLSSRRRASSSRGRRRRRASRGCARSCRRSRCTAWTACVVLRFDRRMQGMGGRRVRRAAAGRGPRRATHGGRARLPLRAAPRGHDRDVARGRRRARLHGGRRSTSSCSTANASAARWCARRSTGATSTRATRLLGRPYRMAGRVRLGQQLGRQARLSRPPTWRCSARSCRCGASSRCGCSGAGLVDHPAVVEPRHAADGQRHRPAARGAPVRLRRRPVRPATSTSTSCSACATSRSSTRSTRWSRRCTATPPPRAPSWASNCWKIQGIFVQYAAFTIR